MRRTGVLMHITSLPGPGGIGSLGQQAYDFADFLAASGVKIWQMLPINPVGYGESPYAPTSVFAGNPMLISIAQLRKERLLFIRDDEIFTPEDPSRVDYANAKENKDALLRSCFAQSADLMQDEVFSFVNNNPWVEGFALFTALKEHFGGISWLDWPDEKIRMRRPSAIRRYRKLLADEIRYHVFVQVLFSRQWNALRSYCNSKGILLMGDMPIYVAADSADAWTRPDVFQLDRNRVPKRVAGVPPDYFSEDGQLWGNPLYAWNRQRLRGYDWWVDRMSSMMSKFDIVRIDHFIGFANYYSVPYGAPNARNGKWVIGPGKNLFKVLKKKLPNMEIVAEDLGEVNDRVSSLIKYVGCPGMRIACYGFNGGSDNMHLPSSYPSHCVAYTGTHDNDTILGWYLSSGEETAARFRQITGIENANDAPLAMIDLLLSSKADLCILPMQDILGLDGTARMNLPGTIGNNWQWRMMPDAIREETSEMLLNMNKKTKRF